MPPGTTLRSLDQADWSAIQRLDTEATGFHRQVVLQSTFDSADAVGCVTGDQLQAFAFRRKFGKGFAIGPVIAPSIDVALALLQELIRPVAGAFVRLDITGLGMNADDLARFDLQPADRVQRMLRGPDSLPSGAPGAVANYALIGQSFG